MRDTALFFAANPGEVTAGFGGVYYMQDLTTDICKSVTTINTTARLIDKRDGKAYWVTKLADKNCWMTQNLDYDVATDDIAAIKKINTPAGWTTTDTSAAVTNTTAAYYDPGDWVYVNGTIGTACPNSTTGLSSCLGYGWMLATGLSASINPNSDYAIDYGTGTYDAHYHIGNYYSWLAATKGSGASVSTNGGIAGDSICPNSDTNKDWQLPLSHTNNNTTSGSFYNLLNQYDLASTPTSDSNSITISPLYLFPGGFVRGGNLGLAGNTGCYWLSTAGSATDAYHLFFNSSTVTPSTNNGRYHGFPVRCLVLGS